MKRKIHIILHLNLTLFEDIERHVQSTAEGRGSSQRTSVMVRMGCTCIAAQPAGKMTGPGPKRPPNPTYAVSEVEVVATVVGDGHPAQLTKLTSVKISRNWVQVPPDEVKGSPIWYGALQSALCAAVTAARPVAWGDGFAVCGPCHILALPVPFTGGLKVCGRN